MTSRMTPLLEHNEHFARTFTPVPLGLPTAQVILITCLDHRVDPALTLGLRLGDAPVLRNAGGRVTQPVIEEIAYLAFLGRWLAGGWTAIRASKSRSFTTRSAGPASSPTPASGSRPPRRPARTRRPSKPPPSPTRTSPSPPTSSACSPHPCSRRR